MRRSERLRISSRCSEVLASAISRSCWRFHALNFVSGSEISRAISLLNFSSVCEPRSEEHTSELQSLRHLVCRLLLEKKKNIHFIEMRITVDANAHTLR